MSKTVMVACRLPNGIILQNPKKPEITVKLNGTNKALIVGATYGLTEVDADFWAAWVAAHSQFPAYKVGAIFAASDEKNVAAKAAEYALVKTGFEKMPQEDKTSGIKKAVGE